MQVMVMKRLLKSLMKCRRYSSCSDKVNRFTYRTHNCGELRFGHVGETVTLCGWLQYIRSNRFLALRDAYGLTQAIIPEGASQKLTDLARNLYLESVVKVIGVVEARPEKDRNRKMETGDIEVCVKLLEVLNPCRPNLPFEVKKYNVVAEESLRMQYRYLYLRHEKMQKTLRLRSEIVAKMRQFLTEEAGFVDVETPTLFRRTPGGAAEFLVPSQHPGQFYSLPQSPQQFKQLLMVGGIDRYFQVARCYRDETTKHDRQPEFTQIDLELSFTSQNEVMKLVESLIKHSWPSDLPEIHCPFPIMTYNDVMTIYGSDKPDLRYGMTLTDVTTVFDNVEGGPLEPRFGSSCDDWSVQMIVGQSAAEHVSKGVADSWKTLLEQNSFAEKFSVLKIQNADTLTGSLAKFLSESLQKTLIGKFGLKIGDLVVVSWGEKRKVQKTLGFLRRKLADCLETKNHWIGNPKEFKFLWVVDFPLFSKKKHSGLESEHHPFTAPIEEHKSLLFEDPEKVTGQHYDLVLNGVELGGGSIRIHDSKTQKYVLDSILGEDPTEMKHLLEALEMGAPPHGGIALGLDRYIGVLMNAGSLRDVIAFPKSSEGRDLMSGAPTKVSDEELDRYNLKIKT